MSNGNSVNVCGNVTRDPELRFTASGQATATFGVAVNRRWQNRQSSEWEESVSYFNVVCWRELAENVAAMKTMMNAMHVKSTGNVDLDFVTMMVPHHQGAIDMAMAVLRHGRNERVKRIAQEIIITQQQEIAAMRLAVGLQLRGPVP